MSKFPIFIYKIFDKINKLSLSATILIGCVILGGFYYFTEINKQKIILQADTKVAEDKKMQEDSKELSLQFCLDEADTKYKKSAQYWLNLENQIGSDNVIKSVNQEKAVLQQDKDECYRRYK